jgi:hypothetical protein
VFHQNLDVDDAVFFSGANAHWICHDDSFLNVLNLIVESVCCCGYA